MQWPSHVLGMQDPKLNAALLSNQGNGILVALLLACLLASTHPTFHPCSCVIVSTGNYLPDN